MFYLHAHSKPFRDWIQKKIDEDAADGFPVRFEPHYETEGQEYIIYRTRDAHDLFVLGILWGEYMASPAGKLELAYDRVEYHEGMKRHFEKHGRDDAAQWQQREIDEIRKDIAYMEATMYT